MALTDEQRAILDFETENQHWVHGGTKETAVRERFAMSEARYFQVLNHLLDDPEALAYAPATVRRLQRLRDARQRQRQRSSRRREGA